MVWVSHRAFSVCTGLRAGISHPCYFARFSPPQWLLAMAVISISLSISLFFLQLSHFINSCMEKNETLITVFGKAVNQTLSKIIVYIFTTDTWTGNKVIVQACNLHHKEQPSPVLRTSYSETLQNRCDLAWKHLCMWVKNPTDVSDITLMSKSLHGRCFIFSLWNHQPGLKTWSVLIT